ncbi:MAG: hypothetical protein HYT37_01775 [Candidatus Sungbacteria bacterium]|nr:hypothetical protein [Candidatus Sungbacteria bacterium]
MSQQSTLITLFILIIAATGYFLYQGIGDQTTIESDPVVTLLESRLAELRRLKDISFDTSVLQDKFFQSLSTPVIPSPPDIKIGRTNPFIPF